MGRYRIVSRPKTSSLPKISSTSNMLGEAVLPVTAALIGWAICPSLTSVASECSCTTVSNIGCAQADMFERTLRKSASKLAPALSIALPLWHHRVLGGKEHKRQHFQQVLVYFCPISQAFHARF